MSDSTQSTEGLESVASPDSSQSTPLSNSGAVSRKRQRGASSLPEFDVFFICALAEECDSIVRTFSREHASPFVPAQFADNTFYRVGEINNHHGEAIRIGVVHQASEGGDDTVKLVQSKLPQVKMRFCFMSGICAGDENKVSFGDVVVAKAATKHAGKAQSNGEFSAETRSYEPSDLILSWIRGMEHDPTWRDGILPYRWQKHTSPVAMQPRTMVDSALHLISHLQKREAHKCQLTQAAVDELLASSLFSRDDLQVTVKYAQKRGWITITHPLTVTETGLELVSDVLAMLSLERGPRVPEATVATMFSSPYVKEDLPATIVRIRQDTAQRKIVGVDMEVHSFYFACKQLKDVEILAAKGVCDYGDKWKDDVWHEIAADNAAAWFLEFIKRHVRSIPRSGGRKMRRVSREASSLSACDQLEVKIDVETQSQWSALSELAVDVRDSKRTLLTQQSQQVSVEQKDANLCHLLKERIALDEKIRQRRAALSLNLEEAIAASKNKIKTFAKQCADQANSLAQTLLSKTNSEANVIIIRDETDNRWELRRKDPKDEQRHVSDGFLINKLGLEYGSALVEAQLAERRKGRKFELLMNNDSLIAVEVEENMEVPRIAPDEDRVEGKVAVEDEPEWSPCESKFLSACRWQSGILWLKKVDQSVMRYKADETIFSGLLGAESKGKYYNQVIKNKLMLMP